jgi:enoyl-CoA hydratase/carnithine racemase
MSGEAEIIFERRGAVGLISLNRPKALNALTHAMCVSMKAQLAQWASNNDIRCVVIQGEGERAFCAGGDIRALYESGKAGTPYIFDFYRDEYLLNAAIKHYPKPYIALLRGIVMGGGVGVSVHGSHRVADESMLFAMPETGIGLFPDVGGSFFLPRLPGALGMYLGLTGARLKTDDARFSGIATHVVAQAKRETLLSRLSDGEAPDDVLGALRQEDQIVQSAEQSSKVNSIFSPDSVEEILARLDADDTDWSRNCAKTIRAKSPTSTKLAFRQIRNGARLNFDDCMRMEFRMVNRVIAGHDFYEGVRATIIDKDGAPNWRPDILAQVSEKDISAYFAPLGDKELPL